jgi:hypothetical protein
LEARWRRVLALAESGKSAVEPAGEELQARFERFRIDRDLITAEETEHWLDQRGLTLEDFDFLCAIRNRSPRSLTAKCLSEWITH